MVNGHMAISLSLKLLPDTAALTSVRSARSDRLLGLLPEAFRL
jgi:hypothetical protein